MNCEFDVMTSVTSMHDSWDAWGHLNHVMEVDLFTATANYAWWINAKELFQGTRLLALFELNIDMFK